MIFRGLSKLFTLARSPICFQPGIMLVLCFVTYRDGYHHAFNYDSIFGIQDNVAIRSLGNFTQFLTDARMISSDPSSQDYRPLVAIANALNYFVSGLDMWSWHAAAVVFHWIFCVLLMTLVRAVARAFKVAVPVVSGIDIGFAAGLIHCVHPLAAHSVYYLWARSTVMAAIFGMLSTIWYIRHRCSGGRVWRLASVASIVLAMMCKIEAASYVVVMFVFELLWLGEFPRTTFKTILAALARAFRNASALFVAITLSYFFWLYQVPKLALQTVSTHLAAPFPDYGYTQTKVWWHYLAQWLLLEKPWTHQPAVEIEHTFLAYPVLLSTLGIIGAGVFCLTISKRQSFAVFFVVAGAITLFPHSSLYPLPEIANGYRPYAAIALFSVALLFPVLRALSRYANTAARRRALLIALSCLIFSLARTSHSRHPIYESGVRFWDYIIQHNPDDPRANGAFGVALFHDGEYREALRRFSLALQSESASPKTLVYCGIAAAKLGDRSAAETYFDRAIASPKSRDDGLIARGHWRLQEGRPAAALEDFFKVLNPHLNDCKLLGGIASAYDRMNQRSVADMWRSRCEQLN